MRHTKNPAEKLADGLNRLMKTPLHMHKRNGDWNVGHFYVIEFIASRKNGYALEQIQTSDGRPKMILDVYKTPEELALHMEALIKGITMGRELGRSEEYARWDKAMLYGSSH